MLLPGRHVDSTDVPNMYFAISSGSVSAVQTRSGEAEMSMSALARNPVMFPTYPSTWVHMLRRSGAGLHCGMEADLGFIWTTEDRHGIRATAVETTALRAGRLLRSPSPSHPGHRADRGLGVLAGLRLRLVRQRRPADLEPRRDVACPLRCDWCGGRRRLGGYRFPQRAERHGRVQYRPYPRGAQLDGAGRLHHRLHLALQQPG